MLKFFESSAKSCHILMETPIVDDDSQMLKRLLSREYDSWVVEFARVCSIGVDIIDILYAKIFIEKKFVSIITHKHKLNRYLTKLGFTSHFESLLKKDVVSLSKIEIILIGGSADSSLKIKEIVANVRLDNSTLVIVQHVESDRVGIFDAILQRVTNYRVSYAKDGERIKKGLIYLAPNDKHLMVKDGCFYLDDGEKHNYSKPSISMSYESFSNFYKEKLLVIQECGYASDGVDKLKLLRDNGSNIVLQNIDECEAKNMVKNAYNLNLHHYMLSLKDIITYINIIDNKTTNEAWQEYLLEKIYQMHNYDFRLYHHDMISRRLNIFMIKHDIKSLQDAVGMILFNSSAFRAFFLEISINVTEFFRNPDSFKEIAMLVEKSYAHSRNLKIWSAGCSSGEEVYSLAIILDSLGALDKALLYATDFNSVILEEAKNATYNIESFLLAKDNFSKTKLGIELDSYVIKRDNYVTISDKIKNKVLFFQHNLITDSSFNEFDIIICKNVVIYFDNNLQNRVFELFYNSLKFGGYLVLGESEMIVSKFADKFIESPSSSKIFKKVA